MGDFPPLRAVLADEAREVFAKLTPWGHAHVAQLPDGEFHFAPWPTRFRETLVQRRKLVEDLRRHDGRDWLYRLTPLGRAVRDFARAEAAAATARAAA